MSLEAMANLLDNVGVGVRKTSQGLGQNLLGLATHLVKNEFSSSFQDYSLYLAVVRCGQCDK